MSDFRLITPDADLDPSLFGGRAASLGRLIRFNAPVPRSVAVSSAAVERLSHGLPLDTDRLLAAFGRAPLLSVRPSLENPSWGGPGALLNVGLNRERYEAMKGSIGEAPAATLFLRFIHDYATHVERLDPEPFEGLEASEDGVITALSAFESEAGLPFPESVETQLSDVLRSMTRAWTGTSARLLRQARGAPRDAGLALVVQSMALGVGPGESGAGVIRLIDPRTGTPEVNGRYLRQSIGRDALDQRESALFLAKDPRGPSLEAQSPTHFRALVHLLETCRTGFREEVELEFAVEQDDLHVLDVQPVQMSSQALVNTVVTLADDGVITMKAAVSRVPVRALTEVLHPQVDPGTKVSVLARGMAASPGAASGQAVFTATSAQAMAARGTSCILIRHDTTSEDVRGMHAAAAILTERGGMTSHAAVIARGLGRPCIVGMSGARISERERTLSLPNGQIVKEGDVITLNGATGELIAGAVPMLEVSERGALETLLSWADDFRDIGVRANADTPEDAAVARRFGAQGIGLCRTEHMFFEDQRLTLMREMIFADTERDREAALSQLLPLQRDDFAELFRLMDGAPVCVRLFDPPLHEFLPGDRDGQLALAEALDLPLRDVARRIEELSEFNPMLGMRGVRLGVTFPEIYVMQARAIFEAVLRVRAEGAGDIVPEIMLPLVSAKREVELIKAKIEAVAATLRVETDEEIGFRLGVMVETPRAALRAAEIAHHAEFLSFGTNDLTQMAYGLSRDDAGRFMQAYVSQGVFDEDPFLTLDQEGVGELLHLGSERGRAGRPDVVLSLCGEHGGDPDTIAFCRASGFDYVSCSPYRVPLARLAAAQIALAASDASGA